MTPNIVEIPNSEMPQTESTETLHTRPKIPNSPSKLAIYLTILNICVHILIGIIVGATLIFSFTFTYGPFPVHMVMCTIGYQLLMAQSILALSPYNTWSANLSLVNKRRVHWVLQIVGSVLAIAGSVIMSLDKAVNWNTLHGKFGLVAMVFTTVSLVNGLTSLYAYELRNIIPGILSRLTHICFGMVAFTTACVSLAYGFNVAAFRIWTSPEIALGIISVTGVFNVILIINPLVVFCDKFINSVKNKLG